MGACMMSNNNPNDSLPARELAPNSRAMIRQEILKQTSTFSFHQTACFAKFSLNSLACQSEISSFQITDENTGHSNNSEEVKQSDTITFTPAPQIITPVAQQLVNQETVGVKKPLKNWSIEEIDLIKEQGSVDNIFAHDQKIIVAETMKTSLPVKLPKIIFKDGSTYQGEWFKAKKHGKGIFQSPLTYYSGYWADDKMQGNGMLVFSNKDKYEGQFKEGMMNGQGRYQQARGTVYEGDFVANKKEGDGIEVYERNQYYQGKWQNGYKHGQGFLQFSDGSYCKGNFLDNFIHGHAQYQWHGQKKKYTGNWVLNKMQGTGIMEWEDGRRYEGNYKNDKMQGFGTYQYANGEKYVGQWKNNKKNGRGQFLLQGGQLLRGVWYEDRLIERFAGRPKKRHAITSTSGKSLTSTR